MEININFVYFEQLQDKPEGEGVVRIVVIRQSSDPTSGEGATDFLPPGV